MTLQIKIPGRFFFSIVLFFTSLHAFAQNPLFRVDPNYVSRHDIVYHTPAYEGFDGFPLGNGDLGGMVWNTNTGYEIQINKNDLFDQNEESRITLRNGVRLNIDLGAPGNEWMYLKNYTGRLSLKDAEVSFDAQTPFMMNSMNTWVSSHKNVWFIHLKSKAQGTLQSGSKMRISLERWGSRTFPGWYGYFSKETENGIGDARSFADHNNIVMEVSYKTLKFSVACSIVGESVVPQKISSNRIELTSKTALADREITLAISMVTSQESADPTKAAIALLNGINQKEILKDRQDHQQNWSKFWDKSFVHLENDYIENLYYLRRYLMESSSKAKFPVVFNGGLWTWNHDVRNWVTPHHWNTQQQYWGLCSQNDCELMLAYLNTYFRLMPFGKEFAKQRGANDAILWSEPHDFFGSMTFWNRADMLNDFTPASQIAGLFWEYFQYTSDTSFLRNKAYPFMKTAASFYLQKLKWDGAKGEYYIFPSQPYESPRSNQLLNPVTDRNMILSNFNHCIQAAQILHTDTDKIIKWKNVVDHIWAIPYRTLPNIGEVIDLAWYPDGTLFPKLDDHGKWLNTMSQNTSSVFPAGITGIDQKGSREFNAISNIINNHSSTVNAISPDPIVAARIGSGKEALRMLENGIRRLQHFPQGLFYNIDHWYNLSLYMDSLKTPDLSAQRDYINDARSHYPNKLPAKPFVQCGLEPQSILGAAVNEMLLQSNESKIRVFPAVPENWEGAFKLLAQGNFLVSSEIKKDGTIKGVYVESKKGNKCLLMNPWKGSNVSISEIGGKQVLFDMLADGTLSFNTLQDHSYLILPQAANKQPERTIYISEINQKTKKLFEATLGKERDF